MIEKPEKLDQQLRLVMAKSDRNRLDALAAHYEVSRNELMRQLITFGFQMMQEQRNKPTAEAS